MCFPAIGFFSQIYSIRRVFLPEEQTVKPIRKQLVTSVKLVPLSHPGHIVPGWSLLQGSQLAKIVGDFFLPQQPKTHSSTIETRKQEEAS